MRALLYRLKCIGLASLLAGFLVLLMLLSDGYTAYRLNF